MNKTWTMWLPPFLLESGKVRSDLRKELISPSPSSTSSLYILTKRDYCAAEFGYLNPSLRLCSRDFILMWRNLLHEGQLIMFWYHLIPNSTNLPPPWWCECWAWTWLSCDISYLVIFLQFKITLKFSAGLWWLYCAIILPIQVGLLESSVSEFGKAAISIGTFKHYKLRIGKIPHFSFIVIKNGALWNVCGPQYGSGKV